MRQAADLAALRRMLEVSDGCFSLSFAVCNDRALRNELIGRLRADFPGLILIELPAETSDVYQTVCAQLSDGSPRGIFVLDLEASVPFEAKTYSTLRSLNSSRELWERLTCPVVFWLAEYAAALMARQAPDFWRYRSHQFEFVSDRATVEERIREPFPDFVMVDGLPFEEKRFRVAELEERLREAGDPPVAELLPHVLAWQYELAYLYRHAGQFDRACELLDNAVNKAESTYGREDTRTATALSNLAHLLQASNRLAEAEPLMRRALAIDERNFGIDHPNIAIRLNNLAQLLHDTNRLAEAEPLMRQALAIDEQIVGKDHPNVAIRLNNLASLLYATNRLSEAEPLMRRALAIDEQSLGKDHPNVAIRLNNLAQLLQHTNRMAAAEPCISRALIIDEQSFGKDHPSVAIRLNNLALLFQATNRLAEAEPLMRRALAIDEQGFGQSHPKVAIRLNNLAMLLKATKRLVEAEPLLRRALMICWTSLGQQHPNTEAVRKNYQFLLLGMGTSGDEIKQRFDEIQRSIS